MLVFIDPLNAFDSVHRGMMWKILWFYGIPGKVIKMIKALHEEHLNAAEKGQTDWLAAKSGLRKRCLFYPILLPIIVKLVDKFCNFYGGVQLKPKLQLYDCCFANDIVFATHFTEDMQRSIKELAPKTSQTVLQINVNKTKATSNGAITSMAGCRKLGAFKIDEVSEFKYLGSSSKWQV